MVNLHLHLLHVFFLWILANFGNRIINHTSSVFAYLVPLIRIIFSCDFSWFLRKILNRENTNSNIFCVNIGFLLRLFLPRNHMSYYSELNHCRNCLQPNVSLDTKACTIEIHFFNRRNLLLKKVTFKLL